MNLASNIYIYIYIDVLKYEYLLIKKIFLTNNIYFIFIVIIVIFVSLYLLFELFN